MNTFDIKIQNEIYTKLESINEQSRNYINDVIVIINREIGIDKITSIILFGSQREIEKKIPNILLSQIAIYLLFLTIMFQIFL